uniref:Uncharacterized protein n=1 Tax=Zea mays TaxID=4577 RepID=C4J875_MAIZE|nr:unknown [Zea mays]
MQPALPQAHGEKAQKARQIAGKLHQLERQRAAFGGKCRWSIATSHFAAHNGGRNRYNIEIWIKAAHDAVRCDQRLEQ